MRARVVLGFAAAALLASVTAFADPSPEEVERARTFFNAGAQAYTNANYSDAVRSFEQAYALSPRPPVLFSLAQAERKQFFASGDVRLGRSAVAHYKEYIDQVQTGGRRAEATEAKADLDSRLRNVDPSQGSTVVQEKKQARVTVYSATAGARVTIDNGQPQELPYFGDLAPGRHHVRVFAEGYFDGEQDVSGDKPVDNPVNLPLKEKPALVTVVLDTSADIYVDGRLAATAPIHRPIEVPPGVHALSVARNGKKPYSQEVALQRGKPFTFEPKLETSGQRVLAYAMLGTGAAALVVGAFAGLGALGAESRVKELGRLGETRNLTADELSQHNLKIDERDAARTTFVVASSLGFGLAAAGALFYFLDKPAIAVLPPRTVEPTPTPKGPEPPIEVTGLRPFPILGPSTVGAGFTARF